LKTNKEKMKTISTISVLLLGISVSFGQVAESIKSASGKDMTPVGVVQMYIATNPPVGWLNCNGASVSTVTYPALFALIGTNYGSTNAAWFNLPDLLGRVPVGKGTGSFASLNNKGGYENVTLTINQMPAHSHALSWVDGGSYATGTFQEDIGRYTEAYTYSQTHLTGGGQAHTNMPPYLTVNYIIKYADVLATSLQTVVPLDGSIPMT
jgi:microcystin-dependent protein